MGGDDHDETTLHHPLLRHESPSSSTNSKIGGGDSPSSHQLHWFVASLIIFGFTAPSCLVSIPFAWGNMGHVLAVMTCLIIFTASACGACLLLEIAIANPSCQNLPEIGAVAMGRLGRNLAATCQLLNFIFFSPVALTINGMALQGMLGRPTTDCVDLYIFIISIFCFMTTQVRVLTNTQPLALMSLGAIILALCIDLGVVINYDNPDKVEAQLFGHPSSSNDHQLTSQDLIQTLLALTTTAWGYVPSFLTIEVSSSMSKPHDFRKSILLAAFFTFSLFLLLGITFVLRWGWDLPAPSYDIEAWPAHIFTSRIMQALILASNIVAYAFNSVPLVRFCQKAWLPNFDINDWSLKAIGTYALISLPAFLFGLAASVLVGNLLILLALVTALSVPFTTQIFPAFFYYYWRKGGGGGRWRSDGRSPQDTRHHHHHPDVLLHSVIDDDDSSSNRARLPPPPPSHHQNGKLRRSSEAAATKATAGGGRGRRGDLSILEWIIILMVGSIGIINFLVCLTAAIGKIAIHDLRGPTVIGCGKWTIYSNADDY